MSIEEEVPSRPELFGKWMTLPGCCGVMLLYEFYAAPADHRPHDSYTNIWKYLDRTITDHTLIMLTVNADQFADWGIYLKQVGFEVKEEFVNINTGNTVYVMVLNLEEEQERLREEEEEEEEEPEEEEEEEGCSCDDCGSGYFL